VSHSSGPPRPVTGMIASPFLPSSGGRPIGCCNGEELRGMTCIRRGVETERYRRRCKQDHGTIYGKTECGMGRRRFHYYLPRSLLPVLNEPIFLPHSPRLKKTSIGMKRKQEVSCCYVSQGREGEASRARKQARHSPFFCLCFYGCLSALPVNAIVKSVSSSEESWNLCQTTPRHILEMVYASIRQ
jgi:hypothetical protein